MRHERWKTEAAFFDAVADGHRATVAPVDPRTLARYQLAALRERFAYEFRFRTLGDLRGKRIVDVGCGEGIDTVLLLKLGAAHVTGVDLSPKALELARQRAVVNGVADRVDFVCGPIETAPIEPRGYDIVWCNMILHHVIDGLEAVLGRLRDAARPDGLLSFAEPVSFNRTLRRIRKLIPLRAVDVTPDERPLEPPEIAMIEKHVADFKIRHFALTGRIDQFVLTDFNYERSSAPRRAIVDLTAWLDAFLLRLPVFDRMGSIAVMWGRPA